MRALAAVLLLLVLPPVPLHAQQSLIRGDEGRRLDSLVRAAESRGFHGNVLVARGGEPLLLAGYGIANHSTGARYSPATLVQIGSNVKDSRPTSASSPSASSWSTGPASRSAWLSIRSRSPGRRCCAASAI